MRKRITPVIIFCFLMKFAYSQENNAYLKYNFSITIETNAFEKLENEIYSEAENEEDSLMTRAIIKGMKKGVKQLGGHTSITELFFFKDTVLIKSFNKERIFVPKNLKNNLNATYEIEYDTGDKKIINGIEGYKIKLIEKRQSSFGELKDITEFYINDKIELPINHYEILELKEKLKLKGLLLEIKSYDADTPGLYYTYTLEDYNLEKQNPGMIEDFDNSTQNR